MTEKPPIQAKRLDNAISQQQEQTLLIDPTFQDLVSKIQQVIINTSQSLKQKIFKFEQKQLLNFKQELFKTQEEFIRLKQERNQQIIKSNVMKEKTQVQAKFNIQMKKSIEMNTKYQEMKEQMKKMDHQENQLTLQIQYIKKKIQKEKYQGKCLDFEIDELQSEKQQQDSKKPIKVDLGMKIFTDLAKKCGQKVGNYSKINHKQKESILKPLSPPQNLNMKAERMLKQKILALKEYIQNIPLELSFMQNKINQTIQRKKQKGNRKQETQKESISQKIDIQDSVAESSQKLSTPQSDADSSVVKVSKQFKLPNLKNKDNKKTLKMAMSTDSLLKTPTKFTRIQTKNGHISSAGKSITFKSNEPLKLDQKITPVEYLPRNLDLLQEILSDSQVKQYLYKLMFQ